MSRHHRGVRLSRIRQLSVWFLALFPQRPDREECPGPIPVGIAYVVWGRAGIALIVIADAVTVTKLRGAARAADAIGVM